MPVGKYSRWLAVVLGAFLGSHAQAGPLTMPPGTWDWWYAGNDPFASAGSSATLFSAVSVPTLSSPGSGPSSLAPSGGVPVAWASSAPVSAPDHVSTITSPSPSPVPAVSSTQGVSTTPAPTTAQPSPTYADAFINLGSGPYPETGSIAGGNPQPWYASPLVASLFGGTPNAKQQADFDNAVLRQVDQTFRLSGINVKLTTDPSVSAGHTISVVSNSTSVPFPNSIGTTDVGGNGFSFIDPIAKAATNVDQLTQIVAHNVAHELMLSFGVPEKFDQTGNYLDATNANWAMITSPTSTFSPAAASAINQALRGQDATGGRSSLAQYIAPQPVPETTTLLAWGLGILTFARFSRTSVR